MARGPFPKFDEPTQRAHDYRHLLARWRQVARAAGLPLEKLGQAGDYPIYSLRTQPGTPGGLYVSAGIHGDEPAGSEALISWAERHLAALVRAGNQALPLLLLPCLNPWGLVNNQRADAEGRDLNRAFDRGDFAPIRELKAMLQGARFDLALCLHEDYDARGIYIYEINRRKPDIGLELLQAASAALPIDPRPRIDGRPFKAGRALRRANLERVPLHPEAIYLYLEENASHVLTFETPSEFGLARRVQAHLLVLEAGVRLVQERRRRPE